MLKKKIKNKIQVKFSLSLFNNIFISFSKVSKPKYLFSFAVSKSFY